MMKKLVYVILVIFSLSSCDKDFLDTKPNQALLIPSKISDLQALLDNNTIMNTRPALNMIADDDAYVTDEGLISFRTAPERNLYLWKENPYEGEVIYDWSNLYRQLFYANVVLDNLAKIEVSQHQETDYKLVKGSGLFFRAMAHYNLVQQFCKAYSANATQDLGIPLRLNSNVNERYTRANLQQTYDQIRSDLMLAKDFLPEVYFYKSRPSKAAALALLAMVNLSMGNYEAAGGFANDCLQLNSKLLNFNTLVLSSNAPFPETLPFGNEEIILHTNPSVLSFVGSSQYRVDTALYQSYSINDLRKQAYFRTRGINHYTFKGYQGLNIPEMYLIRAEVNARKGEVLAALKDLNILLESRWKAGTNFVPVAADVNTILQLVLSERRKELVQKGGRWFDLKRLNNDPATQAIISRKIGGEVITITPNDPRYVFPIPDEEVNRSGILQN